MLDLIFSILKYDEEFKNVGQAIQVCKQWKVPVQRVYYSTITVETQDQVRSSVSSTQEQQKFTKDIHRYPSI